ncbi:DUF917 domain-containing protein [Nocardioides kongjuensis]|uniref:DUF917 domain-containing protein n=1 Tax=Nocardioides kongjuensis TaxID=349522 RepID=A0A852RPZ1_9ACTN|nr:DUF917 domain-containing protein [Nocardioides kongjuensis]NYD32769.1 hypothetical protein [Nocardioides kongjuensis]
MQRVHEIDLETLDALGRGCAVLGTGGGGDVAAPLIAAAHAIRTRGPVPIVQLSDLPNDALIAPLSGIGAPTVSVEMLPGQSEVHRLREAAERFMGGPLSAVMSSEIGGSNGVEPLLWASLLGLPIVDADGMGRAFPEVQMVSMNVAGLPVNVVIVADLAGNVTTIQPIDGDWSERIARAACVAGGASALMADYILTAEQARGAVIEGSVSHAVHLGQSTVGAADPLEALRSELDARVLISGKIVDIERRTGGGFVRGSVVVEEIGGAGRLTRVEIQNENLAVFEDGEVLASVPDLISVVDTQTASAISTESLRYGQRVSVLAWPCHPLWRTDRGLTIAGPRAFGYAIDYVPVEKIGSSVV